MLPEGPRVKGFTGFLGGSLGLLSSSALWVEPGLAQLIPDTTLGAESSVVLPTETLQGASTELIEGGAARGANLFHSFSEFNVDMGQRVYFANPQGIERILSRVTGSNLSNVDGLLGVNGPADLFLLNPNGVIFGPNAQLDIDGSFVASTAASFSFADDSEFGATPMENELLTVSVPRGVQFNDQPQGDIIHHGNLTVDAGETLTLFGDQVRSSGALTAPGGIVQVLGHQVSLVEQATVDVSGTAGGGTALIGGDFRGQGNLPRALQTSVASEVAIAANALEEGNGGTVIVWAEETTEFSGSIATRGGPLGGNGGFVETSGRQSLVVGATAQVDTTASQGQLGTWLLDPSTLEVVDAGGTADINGDTNSPDTASSINADTVVAALDGANITLQADESILVNAAIDASGNEPPGGDLALVAPNITLNQPIALTPTFILSGTATTVTVGAAGSVQNGIDVAADGATVNLAAATFQEGETIFLDRNITLRGAGADSTILDGSNAHRVLQVSGEIAATVENLLITNGNAETSFGAGIFTEMDSSLTLENSEVSNNNAGSGGAGIFSNGNLTVLNSTISNNTTTEDGGGIQTTATGNTLVENSTLSGNSVPDSGGAIANSGILTLRNSTISNNYSGDDSGGIANFEGGTISIESTTISGNTAADNGGAFSNAGTLTITNSLVSGNSAPIGPNTDSGFMSGGNNLFGASGDPGLAGGAALGLGDSVPDVPLTQILETTLADNGGSTQTLALVSDSPAIDAAGATASTTDQRGFSAAGTRDIGAYEFLSRLIVDTSVDEVDDDFGAGDLSLREALQFVEAEGTIAVDPVLAGSTIPLGLGELTIDRSLTINGLGADSLTISGEGESRVFSIGGESAIAVAIDGLTLTQGNAAGSGGAIQVAGNVDFALTNSAVVGNAAMGVGGGLSIIDNVNVTIENSAIVNNTATGNGGGIDINTAPNLGTLVTTVRNSTLSGNSAVMGGGAASLGTNSTLNLEQSTVTQNTAGGVAGSGLSNIFGGQVTLSNSIVSGNMGGETNGPISATGNNLIGGETLLLWWPYPNPRPTAREPSH